MSKPSQYLDLRHSQNLVMTPQLQQAIKLLQLNNIELAEFVEEELEKNPFLEKDERSPEALSEGASDDSGAKDVANDGSDGDFSGGDESSADSRRSGSDDSGDIDDPFVQQFDVGLLPSGGGITSTAGASHSFDGEESSFENHISKDTTLREHLNEQLFVACDDARDRLIGGMLIDQLDESGYLRTEKTELLESLGCGEERFERLLKTVKGFDPTGIFAGDLKECLSLQLEEKGVLDAPMRTLLDNLDILAKGDLKKLGTLCDVNETYLKDMIADIRSLNPKPAASFDHIVVQTVVPDISMRKLPRNLGGGWRVELNNETLPRVLVNQEYYTVVSKGAKDKKDKAYLTTQMASASWLVRAMDQRAQTILKTAAEIIEQQDAFFNYGIEFLQPLKLKDIAEKIEMHESTVSRATTNKYIATPRGVFELKFFFSTALGGEDGGTAHAAEAIKARIKSMIDNENPKKILSDDKIVQMLGEDDVQIARRTVAKYREAMDIPSSVQRRKQKQNSA